MESTLVSAYSSQSRLAAYRSVIAHGAVEDADPHALVITLFDAVAGRLAAARACAECKQTARMAQLLHSSVVLIAELRGSLNLKDGGPLAQNLSALYDYMIRRLMLANLQANSSYMAEVASLLAEIRSAWVAIGPEVKQPALGHRAASAA
jgi:flagellar secretion chaperone FliS